MTPTTMAQAVKLIDELRAELAVANQTIEMLRTERNSWRTASER